ncbi:hypothetical protein LDO31_02935 [Luteimonas sp. XNQY3]|nr:hypothetical protein [Luteimonas sp. XNQY3]MCD9005202.1 hypothetical protein [Luteimonas sp. XNQY3]
MKARPVSSAIVEWLEANPGQHTASDIAHALGHARGTAGYKAIGRTVCRLDDNGAVNSGWVNGSTKHFSFRKPLQSAAPRVEPMVLHRHRSSSLAGLIPAPVGRVRSAEMASRPADRAETVAEFRARGGKVEHVQGFEAVRPHVTRPAWRNAA